MTRAIPAVHAIVLLCVLTLAGCRFADAVGDNRFAGCYDQSCVDVPQAVPGVPALSSISTRSTHACGLTPAGDAWCWGDNSLGQLGDGSDSLRARAVQVTGGLRFSRIAAGAGFTCAIELSGVAYCWGSGAVGQLGQPAPESCLKGQVRCARSPQLVGTRIVTAVAAGIRHACVVDSAGAAWCWGFNALGETGSAAYGETVTAPRRVSGTNVFASIGAGDSYTCALTTAGAAWCWGSGGRGELGRRVPVCNSVYSFANECSAVPVSVSTTATFTRLSVGNSHSCGLVAGGAALCWGDNGQGQLGASTFENAMAPVTAQGPMTFAVIDASTAVTCGTPTSGASVCWGLNVFGKLGIGTRQELSTAPLPISGSRRFTAFAGGDYHLCALTADGAAWCWGLGRDGQLGSGPRAP